MEAETEIEVRDEWSTYQEILDNLKPSEVAIILQEINENLEGFKADLAVRSFN